MQIKAAMTEISFLGDIAVDAAAAAAATTGSHAKNRKIFLYHVKSSVSIDP